MAVLKADAFGHGLLPCARVAADEGLDWVGVGSVDDGLALRRDRFELPILVLGGFADGSEPEAVEAGLTPAVFRSASVRALNAVAARVGHPIGVHLLVDTGMNRLGVPRGLLGRFLDLVEGLRSVYIDGLMTELADSGSPSDERTQWQLEGFHAALLELAERGHRPRWIHAADSGAAMMRRGPASAGASVLVRAGSMLFGLPPSAALDGAWPLRPVMSLLSAISFLKRVPAGASVSYGGTWTASRATALATLPIGFFDGYPRALGNRAEVLIRGRRAQVVGRVGVDLVLVDVTDVPGVQEGDRAILFGRDGDAEVGVQELATLLGGSPVELPCGVGSRVPRVYVDRPAASQGPGSGT